MALLAAVSGACPAVDLSLTGQANAVEEFDTNLFRTTRPHEDAWGQGVDGYLDLSAADTQWNSRLNARFANRWYVTDNNLDYFNQFFKWENQYRGERSLWKFNGRYDMDTTLTSADALSTDLGYVFRRIPRTTRNLSPSWSYSLRDDTLLNLSYDYVDTSYDARPDEATRVVDSRTHTGGLSLSHQWNEHLSLFASASYTDYTLKGIAQTFENRLIPVNVGGVILLVPGTINIPAVDNSVRTASVIGGFELAFTDTLSIAFSGGAQYNQTETPEFSQTTLIGGAPGPTLTSSAQTSNVLTDVFTANAQKRFEYSDIAFDYARSVSPNLQGFLTAYDRYTLTGKHRFTDCFSASMNLSYSEQSSPSGKSLNFVDREYFSTRTALSWRWDQNWTVDAGYQYSRIDYPSASGSADSHGLYLNLRYLFDQQTL